MEVAMKNKAGAVALGLSFGFVHVLPVSAHHEGQCYISHNKHHICVVRIGEQEFAAAITNGLSIEPTVVAFHCLKGWSGAGVLPEESMAKVVSAICAYSGQEQRPPVSVAGRLIFEEK